MNGPLHTGRLPELRDDCARVADTLAQGSWANWVSGNQERFAGLCRHPRKIKEMGRPKVRTLCVTCHMYPVNHGTQTTYTGACIGCHR